MVPKVFEPLKAYCINLCQFSLNFILGIFIKFLLLLKWYVYIYCIRLLHTPEIILISIPLDFPLNAFCMIIIFFVLFYDYFSNTIGFESKVTVGWKMQCTNTGTPATACAAINYTRARRYMHPFNLRLYSNNGRIFSKYNRDYNLCIISLRYETCLDTDFIIDFKEMNIIECLMTNFMELATRGPVVQN